MKLLLDDNFSERLAFSLADLYPDLTHVRAVGLSGAQDADAWTYAREHGFAIVSKDSELQSASSWNRILARSSGSVLEIAPPGTWNDYCALSMQPFAPLSRKT